MRIVLLNCNLKILQSLKVRFLSVYELLLVVYQFIDYFAVLLYFSRVLSELLVRVIRLALL